MESFSHLEHRFMTFWWTERSFDPTAYLGQVFPNCKINLFSSYVQWGVCNWVCPIINTRRIWPGKVSEYEIIQLEFVMKQKYIISLGHHHLLVLCASHMFARMFFQDKWRKKTYWCDMIWSSPMALPSKSSLSFINEHQVFLLQKYPCNL